MDTWKSGTAAESRKMCCVRMLRRDSMKSIIRPQLAAN